MTKDKASILGSLTSNGNISGEVVTIEEDLGRWWIRRGKEIVFPQRLKNRKTR